MAELLRRGMIACLAPAGVPTAVIIVTDVIGARLCSVQVKSRRDIGSDGGWHMGEKHEKLTSDRLYYCFVDFGKTQLDVPKKYLLPSAVVAKVLTESHQAWLKTPGAKGQLRKDGQMRRLLPDYKRIFVKENPYPAGWLEVYRDAWHLLAIHPD
jgi:hypothetical protein